MGSHGWRRGWTGESAGAGAAALLVASLLSVSAPGKGLGTQISPGDPVPETVEGELGRSLDDLARRAETFGFSGQVLVEVDGTVVLHGAYGYAEPASGRRMTIDTPVPVASVSKQFAAAAVLRLVEEGRLTSGDSLPVFFDDVPDDKSGVTLHHLLTHTAGVSSPYDDEFEPDTREALVRGILERPPAFTPGADWRYSGAGYNLVAAIVERVVDDSYGAFLARTFFRPAGMDRTGLVDDAWAAMDPAHAHVGWIDHGSPATWPRNPRAFGAGDLVTTAADLYRWERLLGSGSVLAAGAVARMRSVQHRMDAGIGYGYGMFVHIPEGGPTVVEHGGDARLGFNAAYSVYPDEDFLVVITSNVRTPAGRSLRHALGRRIERTVRGETAELPPEATPLDPDDVHRLTGSYNLDGGEAADGDARVHMVSDGARLWLVPLGQAALDLATGEPGSFDFDGANRKARALLDGLVDRRDSLAFAGALGQDGVEHINGYLEEWRNLVDARGPFRDYRLLGSRPLGRGGVVTLVRLRFRSGIVTISYFWGDRGSGRIRGSFQHLAAFRPPLGLVVGRTPDGELVAHDPVGGETLRARVRRRDGGLQLEFTGPSGSVLATARRTGLAGWIPPF